MRRAMHKNVIKTKSEVISDEIAKFSKFGKKFYHQGVAGFTSGRAPTELLPTESFLPEKERVQNTFYDGELARVLERLAHTWVAPFLFRNVFCSSSALLSPSY